MKISITKPLAFKYLALPNGIGARGGVSRFFMLAHDIPFTEELFTLGPQGTWGAEKERLVASGENPSGTVPVLVATSSDDDEQPETPVYLAQHIATLRFLARSYGLVGTNEDDELYIQDLVADEYQNWRDLWVDVTFSGSDADKLAYREETLPKILTKFEALYKKWKTHAVYLSISPKTKQPLWGDAAVFGLTRDQIVTGHLKQEALEAGYPHLAALFKTFGSIPAVAAWIAENTPKKK